METLQVKIGPSFFEGAFRDYSNWQWALVREFMQNCLDAPNSSKVDINVSINEESNTVVTVFNNGSPMDRDILTNKLLCLGESGKRFQEGAVGGFGKAKELLYMCHMNYEIITGDLKVYGEGGEYVLDNCPYLSGTKSTITIKGDVCWYIQHHLREFARMAQWKGTLTLNGEVLECSLKKGYKRQTELDWAEIYTTPQHIGRIIVRMGGIPMFYIYCNYRGGGIIVELKGNSGEVLTSNRDSMKWEFRDKLISFATDLEQNSKRALRDRSKIIKKKWEGYKLAYFGSQGGLTVTEDLQEPIKTSVVGSGGGAAFTEGYSQLLMKAPASLPTYPDFNIWSEVGKVPKRYLPGSLNANSLKLLNVWAAILLRLCEITNTHKPFGIGFVFDPETKASHLNDGGDHVLYINPAFIKEEGRGYKFTQRWNFSEDSKWGLVAEAAHEFVHFEGNKGHNEDFAARFTDLMGIVLMNKSKFTDCFTANNLRFGE